MKTIYIDLDGVLADFIRGFSDMYGKPIETVSKKDLDTLFKKKFAEDHFFRSLPLMPKAKQLIEFCLAQGVNVEILTAVGSNDVLINAKDKEKWSKKYAPSLKFNYVSKAHQKTKYANPNSFLIDDRYEKSLKPFLNANGEGYLYTKFDQKLKNAILEFTKEIKENKMIPFKEYFFDKKQLNEKLLLINNGKKYGQIVFLAGGAGSGKGFISTTFMNNADFKTVDVDEWKKAFLEMAKTKDKYKELRGLDLKNPDDVSKLHVFVDNLGIKDKTFSAMLSTITNPDILPNVIFDVTLKNTKSMDKMIPMLMDKGYKAENIHIVWGLTDYKVAIEANATRERVVAIDILLGTHRGAAKTMWEIIGKGNIPKGVDGGIYVVLNNRENTVFFKNDDGKGFRGKKDSGDNDDKRFSTGGKEKNRKFGGSGKGKFIVKDFKYLTFKKPKKKPTTDAKIKAEFTRWVMDNVPKDSLK